MDDETQSELAAGQPRIAGRAHRRLSGADFTIWAIRVGVIGSFLLLWEVAAREQWISPIFIGQPTLIAGAFMDLLRGPVLTTDLPTTLIETAIGFVIGSTTGVVGGLIFARFQLLHEALRSLLTALNSLPRVALAPLFIIWFGLGIPSKVALAASLVFFIVLLSTIAALTQTDRDVTLLARSMGATEFQRLLKFVLPGAVPTLVAGLELGLVYSFLGAVVGEIIGGQHGLGVVLTFDANVFKTNEFFATLFLLAVVTTGLTSLVRVGERRILRWHYVEMRGARS